jgi:hypothetical protein
VNPSVKPPPVDMTLFSDNRERLVAALRAAGASAKSVVVLEGGAATTRHDTGVCGVGGGGIRTLTMRR